MKLIHLSVGKDYEAGDRMPRNASYTDFIDWSEAQIKAGIGQEDCAICGKPWCPQDMSDEVKSYELLGGDGKPVQITKPICLDCVDNTAP